MHENTHIVQSEIINLSRHAMTSLEALSGSKAVRILAEYWKTQYNYICSLASHPMLGVIWAALRPVKGVNVCLHFTRFFSTERPFTVNIC